MKTSRNVAQRVVCATVLAAASAVSVTARAEGGGGGIPWIYDDTARPKESTMSATVVASGGVETFGVERVESNGLAPFRTTPRAAVFIIR